MVNLDMWTELILPVELTGYARARLEDYERTQWGSLSAWLPNETIPDIVARFLVGQTGLQPVAEFRSYDAETPLGSLPGAQRVVFELPPLGMKMRVSEYEQLRARGNLSQVVLRTSVERITERIVDAISDRLEYERGYALQHAKLLIDDETGFKQSGDWGRTPLHEVSATDNGGVFWDNVNNADPLGQLTTWTQQYILTNGYPPGSLLTSTQVLAYLQRNEGFRQLAMTFAGTPSVVTREAINAVLSGHGIPPITTYDRIVNLRGVTTRVLEPEYVFLLPSPDENVGGAHLGKTYWGETLEASEPEYGIQPLDRPGIVVGAWKTRDPIARWVHGSAIGLAVLGDANLSFRAQVLDDSS